MVFIYILKLESNKYYVGKTTNPKFRFNDHFNANGSAWTKKYKPIKVIELIPNCDNFDEDKYTKIYMEKYGINNVRGGTFCQIKLNSENINTIKKELNSATDKCYICGETGHFANACENNYDNELKKIYDKIYKLLEKEDKCFRCHRIGHYFSDCYAKTYDNGGEIIDEEDEEEEEEEEEIWTCEYCDKEFDTLKGITCHQNLYCKKKNQKSNKCNRCGRKGHNSSDCYADTHANGESFFCEEEEVEIWTCEYCNKEFDTLKGATYHENVYCKKKQKNKCYRCGRFGHTASNCYASTSVKSSYSY